MISVDNLNARINAARAAMADGDVARALDQFLVLGLSLRSDPCFTAFLAEATRTQPVEAIEEFQLWPSIDATIVDELNATAPTPPERLVLAIYSYLPALARLIALCQTKIAGAAHATSTDAAGPSPQRAEIAATDTRKTAVAAPPKADAA